MTKKETIKEEDLCSFHQEDPEARPEYKGYPITDRGCPICQKHKDGQKKEERILNMVEIYNKT